MYNTPMFFENEADLQQFIHWIVGGRREVTLNPEKTNRIDVMNDTQAIEVKPFLTESNLDESAGQLKRYSPYVGNRQLIIAGMTPKNFDQTVMNRIESFKVSGITVWLVDQMEMFTAHYQRYRHEFGGGSNAATHYVQSPYPVNYPAQVNRGSALAVGQQMNPMLNQQQYTQTPYMMGGQPYVYGNFGTEIGSVFSDKSKESKPASLYEADNINVFVLGAGFFLSLMLLITIPGLYKAYADERMPVPILEKLFLRRSFTE